MPTQWHRHRNCTASHWMNSGGHCGESMCSGTHDTLKSWIHAGTLLHFVQQTELTNFYYIKLPDISCKSWDTAYEWRLKSSVVRTTTCYRGLLCSHSGATQPQFWVPRQYLTLTMQTLIPKWLVGCMYMHMHLCVPNLQDYRLLLVSGLCILH